MIQQLYDKYFEILKEEKAKQKELLSALHKVRERKSLIEDALALAEMLDRDMDLNNIENYLERFLFNDIVGDFSNEELSSLQTEIFNDFKSLYKPKNKCEESTRILLNLKDKACAVRAKFGEKLAHLRKLPKQFAEMMEQVDKVAKLSVFFEEDKDKEQLLKASKYLSYSECLIRVIDEETLPANLYKLWKALFRQIIKLHDAVWRLDI